MEGRNKSLGRFKSLRVFQSSAKASKEDKKEHTVHAESRFMQLSPELRLEIYKHAFTRSPTEHFKALHYGPQASSASGLLFTCRQVREEAKAFLHADTVINLWPHVLNEKQQDAFMASTPPILAAWRKSPPGRLLKHSPDQVSRLGLLLNLTKETKSMAQDYVDVELLQNPTLKVTDLYLRVCICGSILWLHDNPFNIMGFCIALETFAHGMPSLERIHVMYCGQQWPVWLEASKDNVPFPDIVFARHTVRMYSGGNWSVKRTDEKANSWSPTVSRDSSQVQPTPRKPSDIAVSDISEEAEVEKVDKCKLQTVMTWNHAQAHPGESATKVPWNERSVEVDYYDSRTVISGTCVKDKPSKTRSEFPDFRP
jgi:hypothetical protein